MQLVLAPLRRRCYSLLHFVLQVWQDEEFLEQNVHKQLGAAAGQAYSRARRADAATAGDTDLSDLLFAILDDLQQFDYAETFTGPFDVPPPRAPPPPPPRARMTHVSGLRPRGALCSRGDP